MPIPKCRWRFGEPCLVSDFVTPDNVGVREAAELLKGDTPDKTIENVTKGIIPFTYPLDKKGNPCASGQSRRYQYSWCKWMHSRYVYYMWSYPNEVLLTQRGICIDTANLCTSVLRALDLDAWTVLGEIHKAKPENNDQLIGYHAWTNVMYKGEWHTIETTVEENVNIIFPITSTCMKISEWAQGRNLYYLQESKFRENNYIAGGMQGGIMAELIGLPVSVVQKKGFYNTLALAGVLEDYTLVNPNPKLIAKEWHKEERQAKSLIRAAYHV